MRSEMAHPCCGPSAKVLRIRRSNVPWGRSMRCSAMCSLLLLQEDSMAFCRSARGQGQVKPEDREEHTNPRQAKACGCSYLPSIASQTFLVSTFCTYFTILPFLK